MLGDHRNRFTAAVVAGLVGLGAIVTVLTVRDNDERVRRGESGLGAARMEHAAPRTAPGAAVDGGGGGDVAGREDGRVGPARVGARRVGPARVGPARVGPKIVGPKIVGPKIVGPRTVGPKRAQRWVGGGGGRPGLRDDVRYPPGWTRTVRQGPGRHVPHQVR